MSELEYAKIVASNLRRIMYEHNKTQADIAKDLHISKATVSSWINGTRVPRMPKIDLLCHYFNVKRSDIMEIHDDTLLNDNAPKSRLLSPDEASLLDDYGKLNSEGKAEAQKRVNELTEIKKYIEPDNAAVVETA